MRFPRRHTWPAWPEALALIAAWAILLALAQAAPAELRPLRPLRQSPRRGILGELEARLPAGQAARYAEPDPVSCGHYYAHAMNSAARNRHGRGYNAAYLPGGHALILPEPPGITLADVARGTANRGSVKLNLADWNARPLYLLDELTAYLAGAVAGLENGSRRRALEALGFADDVRRHALTLARLARQRRYRHADELDQFLDQAGAYTDQLYEQALTPPPEPYEAP